jgi:hypothetical protein
MPLHPEAVVEKNREMESEKEMETEKEREKETEMERKKETETEKEQEVNRPQQCPQKSFGELSSRGKRYRVHSLLTRMPEFDELAYLPLSLFSDNGNSCL